VQDSRRKGRFAVVNVTDGTDIYVRLITLKFFCHTFLLCEDKNSARESFAKYLFPSKLFNNLLLEAKKNNAHLRMGQ
jgi:hypothetical protein